MILCLKTDSQETYIGLWDNQTEIVWRKWESGRELSNQLLGEIETLLKTVQLRFEDLTGVIIYEGPGSYTGLRIGFSVANALGYSLNIPVMQESGEDWIMKGLKKYERKSEFIPVSPVYGGQIHITKPKK